MVRRLHKTLADYVVLAISPALVMMLVGSLVFFLIAVFYQGQHPARLTWVMACFVFAAVLIGRISIEEGLERAMPFGIALAVVVGMAVNSFLQFRGDWIGQFGWIINWGLIAVVWWSVHKLTWDSTMIDDAQDASGEGLLQVAGLDRPGDKRNAPSAASAQSVEGTTARDVPAGWWQRYVEHQRRPHAPGVWVVYFSLAALPLYGFGQWFIPAENVGLRRYAFWLLCLYVASGMGLLLATSFLGLRRYLRQRRIEMPTRMASLWLGIGAAIIVLLLVVSALLPRPSPEYSIAELPFTVGSPVTKSSRIAPVPREGVEDERPGPAPQRNDGQQAKPGGATTDGKQSATSGGGRKPGGGSQGSDRQGQQSDKREPDARADDRSQANRTERSDDSNEPNPSDQQPERHQTDAESPPKDEPQAATRPDDEQAEQDGEQTAAPSEPPAADAPSTFEMPPAAAPFGALVELLKWAFYAAFVLLVIYFVWRYRAEVLAALRDFLARLRDFWSGLFGGRRSRRRGDEAPVRITVPLAPFSSYADPFATGVAGRYPLEELVRYSFEAFEAWAREHACQREPEQTPHELARDVAKLNAYIRDDARSIAELYARVAYAEGELPDTALDQLRQLWQVMRQPAAEAR